VSGAPKAFLGMIVKSEAAILLAELSELWKHLVVVRFNVFQMVS